MSMMSLSDRPAVPADTDLLCEACGYILNGLPDHSKCPECGEAIARSVLPDVRKPSPIEVEWSDATFRSTTWAILFRKRSFFSTTYTRGQSASVDRFGRRHRTISAVLFTLALLGHGLFMFKVRGPGPIPARSLMLPVVLLMPLAAIAVGVIVFVVLDQTGRLAAYLTSKESRFWGMRLPADAIGRAMQFHSANYLPVGILFILITWGYHLLLFFEFVTLVTATTYLLTLCVAVVLSAVWLFESFVIAMRRIRFANF
jgi:hypothetical protein